MTVDVNVREEQKNQMEHTEQEKKIIDEYVAAVDTDVKLFVEGVLSGADRQNYVTVAFISPKAAEKIESLTGKRVCGNRVVLDRNAIRHIEKRHGVNGKQDQSMSDVDDIARIGYVIMNFDEITYNGDKSFNHIDENGQPSPMVQFSKKIDGTVYVVQTVSEVKSGKNHIVTAYIKKKQPSNPC